jgi:hypothetical protein
MWPSERSLFRILSEPFASAEQRDCIWIVRLKVAVRLVGTLREIDTGNGIWISGLRLLPAQYGSWDMLKTVTVFLACLRFIFLFDLS